MAQSAVVSIVIALIAALLGLDGSAGLSVEMGWFFAILSVVLLVVALIDSRGPAAVS